MSICIYIDIYRYRYGYIRKHLDMYVNRYMYMYIGLTRRSRRFRTRWSQLRRTLRRTR